MNLTLDPAWLYLIQHHTPDTHPILIAWVIAALAVCLFFRGAR
jgi:hypothetical protein